MPHAYHSASCRLFVLILGRSRFVSEPGVPRGSFADKFKMGKKQWKKYKNTSKNTETALGFHLVRKKKEETFDFFVFWS
jgi:hypothetical protein